MSTKSVRDAFFASPQFPRLLNPDSIKDTIARGVENGMLAYVGKRPDGGYAPFHWNTSLLFQDVEISDDVFLIQREVADAYTTGNASRPVVSDDPVVTGGSTSTTSGGSTATNEPDTKSTATTGIPRLVWSGDVPHQKWMNFYTKVLSKFSSAPGLKLTLRVEVAPPDGLSSQKVNETKVALRELGLKDSLDGE